MGELDETSRISEIPVENKKDKKKAKPRKAKQNKSYNNLEVFALVTLKYLEEFQIEHTKQISKLYYLF